MPCGSSSALAQGPAHRFYALFERGVGGFYASFIFDDGHAIEAVFDEGACEGGEVEGAGADDDIFPLGVRSEREILEVDAIDATSVALDPLDRVAEARADLHAPGGVDTEADLGAAEGDQVVEDVGTAAKHIAAMAMEADADAKLSRPLAQFRNRCRIGLNADVGGDVLGSRLRGALEPGALVGEAMEGLDPKRKDGDAFTPVDGDDLLERFRLVKIGVDGAKLDGVEANLANLPGHNGILFEGAEAVALHAEVDLDAHDLKRMNAG